MSDRSSLVFRNSIQSRTHNLIEFHDEPQYIWCCTCAYLTVHRLLLTVSSMFANVIHPCWPFLHAVFIIHTAISSVDYIPRTDLTMQARPRKFKSLQSVKVVPNLHLSALCVDKIVTCFSGRNILNSFF
jgi:hypothetical protein